MKKLQVPLYLGLIHHPIKNKQDEIVTTSVTNMDIHDISRSCRTFGVKKYFIVTPLEIQHKLINRILGHWEKEESSAYNPDRFDALSKTELIHSFEDALVKIEEIEGKAPLVAVTGANFSHYEGEEIDLIKRVRLDQTPIFLLFGTGWGLSASIVERADFRLTPLFGAAEDGYNHLSVRSAVAIYLDRLQRSL